MSDSCVCCQAARVKANGVDATLVLLFTLAGDHIGVCDLIEALCKKHGSWLDKMIYGNLVGRVKPKKKRTKA
jgi:hypothetical protein